MELALFYLIILKAHVNYLEIKVIGSFIPSVLSIEDNEKSLSMESY